MTFSTRMAAAVITSLLLAGPALAQSTATAPAKTDAPAATDKKARSATSLECSKEADEKGLHGKERKKFRSACKKDKGGSSADSKAK
jgi:invasion protein IalB